MRIFCCSVRSSGEGTGKSVACRYFAGGKNLSADILRKAQKSLLVARGGIEPPTQGFSNWLAYRLDLVTVTHDGGLKRSCGLMMVRLSRYTPTPATFDLKRYATMLWLVPRKLNVLFKLIVTAEMCAVCILFSCDLTICGLLFFMRTLLSKHTRKFYFWPQLIPGRITTCHDPKMAG